MNLQYVPREFRWQASLSRRALYLPWSYLWDARVCVLRCLSHV